MLGLTELLALLLSLGGFGVDANPKAPDAGEVMRYAVADADYMVHVDVAALAPKNYKALTALPDVEPFKSSAEMRRGIAEMLSEIEAARTMFQGSTGIDFVHDITSVTAWVSLPKNGEPTFFAVVRGAIPAEALDNVARMMGGQTRSVGGHDTLTSPDGEVMAGMAPTGELLVGTPAWVTQRLSPRWKTPRFARRSAGWRASQLLDEKPFAALVSAPSKTAKMRLRGEIGNDEPFVADLFTSHSFAAVALLHDGIGWTWTDTTRRGHDAAVMASEGMLEMFRASHHGARGLAYLVMSFLESYRGTSREIDLVLKNKAKLLTAVRASTGDGSFKAKVTKSPRTRTVTVRASGKSFSDVVPIAGVLPAIGAAVWLVAAGGSDGEMSELNVMGAEKKVEGEKAGSTLKVRKTYDRVKRKRR